MDELKFNEESKEEVKVIDQINSRLKQLELSDLKLILRYCDQLFKANDELQFY
jgi:hypothetical protein